ncbi:MAG: pyridoxamine 5'-phosphate oxidase family protein [Methanomassiliicoccales archaeon]|nr:MAG: pyridoxamine 5'-phosphate oxidase family protein [Methanomassiliicoccales archaeon]
MPKEVVEMFNNPQAVKVLTTISADGTLHSVRVGSLIAPAPNLIAVGAILMKTSSKNMEHMKQKNQQVALLVGAEMKSYLVQAKIKEVHKSGPLFDKMNENLKAIGLQASAVWTFEPTGVWNQSANYEAGKKIA